MSSSQMHELKIFTPLLILNNIRLRYILSDFYRKHNEEIEKLKDEKKKEQLV
jgi:hypothetical protein